VRELRLEHRFIKFHIFIHETFNENTVLAGGFIFLLHPLRLAMMPKVMMTAAMQNLSKEIRLAH
jgi:hypothetical protein